MEIIGNNTQPKDKHLTHVKVNQDWVSDKHIFDFVLFYIVMKIDKPM